MNRVSSLVSALVVSLLSLAAVPSARPLVAAESAGGAEFVHPNAQRGTDQLQTKITKAIAKLEKIGTKAAIAEAAKIDEKYQAAKRVKDGEPPKSPDLELHVIGLYEGKASPDIDGLGAKVHVTMTHAPLVLCLTSYEPVTWMLEIDEGVDLRQVILGGQKSSATGVPDGIPIADYSRPRETGKHVAYCYSKNDEDSGSQAYDRLCKNLEDITAMRPRSFDGSYNPQKTFVVGPESNVWCNEMSYGLMREAWLLATQSDRQAIWNELLALRFPSTYTEGGRFHGGKQYFGTHTVLGPIKGMQKLVEQPQIDRRSDDVEFKLVRPSGEVDVLKWDDELHLPTPRGMGSYVFDSKRKRWVMVCNTERGGYLYDWSSAEKKWSALRSMTGLNIQAGLTYSEEQDRFFGVGSGMIMHTGRNYPIIYTLHPKGAAVGRLPLDKLNTEGGHRHFIQTSLGVAGDYFLMREAQQDHSQPESPQKIATKVLHRKTGELVADVPGFGVATIEEQQKKIAELLTTNQNKAAGHLAEIPKVKEDRARKRPKRKPGEPERRSRRSKTRRMVTHTKS